MDSFPGSRPVASQEAAGFAANQLGFNWAITMVSIPDPEIIKKFRKDATQPFESLLINPSYEGIGDDKTIDWEACFSIPDKAVCVPRFTHIRYCYQDEEGYAITNTASGFLARVLQHEIDHLNGILCIDRAEPTQVLSIAEYRALRTKSLASED